MRTEALRIAGEKIGADRGGDRMIEVFNPYTASVIGSVPKATLEEVRRAVPDDRTARDDSRRASARLEWDALRKRARTVVEELHQRRDVRVDRLDRLGHHEERVAIEELLGLLERAELLHRHRLLARVGGEGRAAAPAPRRHDDEEQDTERERDVAPLEELERVGG
jgi:acyl-CoA reductase-like NAD-dependent aldehyde dehydrogenase